MAEDSHVGFDGTCCHATKRIDDRSPARFFGVHGLDTREGSPKVDAVIKYPLEQVFGVFSTSAILRSNNPNIASVHEA